MKDVDINKSVVVSSLKWKFVERCFSQIAGLVVQIVLARLLLPADFGSLAIIAAIVSYLGIFVQSGLSAAVIQKKKLDEGDVSTLITCSMLIALVMYVGLFIGAPYISRYYEMPGLTWPIRVLGIGLFLSALNSVQTGILTRQMRFKTLFLRSAVAIPLSGFVGIVMAYLGFGIWALVAHTLLNTLIIIIFMNMLPDLRITFGFCYQKAKEIYSFSLKILMTNLISGFGDTIRTMSIGKKYTAGDLAFYDKAYTYSHMVTNMVNSTVSGVLLPTFSRKQDDIDSLKSMARRSIALSAYAMIPCLAIVMLIAYPLIDLLLTEKWLPCVPYMMIFCLLRMPGCITSVDRQVYLALGKSQIGLYYEIFILTANLVMLYITIPMGVMSIAIGALTVEMIGSFMVFVISYFVYKYSLWERLKDLLPTIIITCIMYATVYYLPLNAMSSLLQVIVKSIAAAAVFVLFSVITKNKNFQYATSLIKNRKKK